MPLSEAWRQNKPLWGCTAAVWTRSGMVSEDKCLTGKTTESYRETPCFTWASLGEQGRVGGRIIQVGESQWSRKQKRNACTPLSMFCLLPHRVLTSHKELPVSLSAPPRSGLSYFLPLPLSLSAPSVHPALLGSACFQRGAERSQQSRTELLFLPFVPAGAHCTRSDVTLHHRCYAGPLT